MKSILAPVALATALVTGAAGASTMTVLYDADFSIGTGITHTTSSPPAVGPVAISGPNFTIGYDNAPATDTTTNFFATDGDSIISSDFGGLHFLDSDSVDVSAWNEVTLDFMAVAVGGDAFNASAEFLSYYYVLGNGPEVTFATFNDSNPDDAGDPLNASIQLNVNGVSNLSFGLFAFVNGADDGFDITSITLTGTTPVPLPAGAVLLLAALGGLGAAARRRA